MTKGFLGFGFASIIFLSMMLSCTHTPEEILPPKDELCDSTDITYTETVFSILNENCISCHNEANPSGGINLSNYQNSKAVGAINPGSYGSLLGTIKWSGLAAPTGGVGISIYSFISNGTNWYGMRAGTNFG